MVLEVCNRTPKKHILQKNWIISQPLHCYGCNMPKYKFLSEVCFGMIFSNFAFDIMDTYGHNGM